MAKRLLSVLPSYPQYPNRPLQSAGISYAMFDVEDAQVQEQISKITPRCRSRSRRCCTGCLPPVDRPAARSGHTLRIRTQLTWWFSPLRRIAVARPRVGRMLSSRLGPLMESQKVPAVVSASVSEMSA